MSADSEKIEIENFTTPGKTYRVDRIKFEAMRRALLLILPQSAPGLSVAEAKVRLLPLLPHEQFPHGEKAGWWLKAVQLDLEAKGVIERKNTKPLRLYRVK
jgi:hypothetical protein